ncbi:hypothetical protein [Pseudomonas sp. RIT-To-2]|uniref:hypothetical protein n=1 Tax=Pseudomonas sp. RIT-To-2 TaxID=3462541 RepID=UPI002413A6B2
MREDLTEEEMRQALFGATQAAVAVNARAPVTSPASVTAPIKAPAKRKASKPFTPRLRVVLEVSNEFEGKTYEFVHEADTLSTLLAQQDATKAARKKYRYVEVVSVTPM